MAERYALIAGNGRFPFLVLEAARSSGRPMLVAAVRQEADPELEKLANGEKTAARESGLNEDPGCAILPRGWGDVLR